MGRDVEPPPWPSAPPMRSSAPEGSLCASINEKRNDPHRRGPLVPGPSQ